MSEILDPDRIRMAAHEAGFAGFMRFTAVSEGNSTCRLFESPRNEGTRVLGFGRKLFVCRYGAREPSAVAGVAMRIIEEEIRPDGQDLSDVVIFTCDAATFRSLKGLYSDRSPAVEWRERYVSQASEEYVGASDCALPPGYEIVQVDKSLLASKMDNLGEMMEEMCSERPSVDDFLEKSFGVAAVESGEIAGWCFSEYNCSQGCEVGIEVVEKHRRKGIAKAMVGRFLELASEKGHRKIGWDCYRSNSPSWKTALAAGFRIDSVYPTLSLIDDEALRYGVNGFSAAYEGDIEAAESWYVKSASTGNAPDWVKSRLAAILAGKGRLKEASLVLSTKEDDAKRP